MNPDEPVRDYASGIYLRAAEIARLCAELADEIMRLRADLAAERERRDDPKKIAFWVDRLKGQEAITDRTIAERDAALAAIKLLGEALLDVKRNGLKYHAHRADEALAAADEQLRKLLRRVNP